MSGHLGFKNSRHGNQCADLALSMVLKWNKSVRKEKMNLFSKDKSVSA